MPRPRPLPEGAAVRTLAHRLTGRADRIRQLSTRFGIRSRRVFLVHVRWTGQEIGEGNEQVVSDVELLPTPRVSDATAVSYRPWSGGDFPEGSLRLDQISAGAYTLDVLMGRRFAQFPPNPPRPTSPPVEGSNLAPRPPANGEFFYEVVEDGRGDDPPERERFRLFGRPWRKEDSLYFSVVVEPQSGKRNRDETTTSGLEFSAEDEVE